MNDLSYLPKPPPGYRWKIKKAATAGYLKIILQAKDLIFYDTVEWGLINAGLGFTEEEVKANLIRQANFMLSKLREDHRRQKFEGTYE